MRWELQWSGKKSFVDALPDHLRPEATEGSQMDRPELLAGLSFYWLGFVDLCASRRSGWSAGPIPFEAIDTYAARLRISDPEDFERFQHLIRALDDCWLTHVREQQASTGSK